MAMPHKIIINNGPVLMKLCNHVLGVWFLRHIVD